MKLAVALMLCVVGTTWAADGNVRGRFYWGHEVESFQPCGSKSSYWVVGEENILQPLRAHTERLREKRGKPYQPIYVEAAGLIDTNSRREGFAEKYDGLFHLRIVTSTSELMPKDCVE